MPGGNKKVTHSYHLALKGWPLLVDSDNIFYRNMKGKRG